MDARDLVVRFHVVLVNGLEVLQAEQQEVELVWEVVLQVAEFSAEGNGSCVLLASKSKTAWYNMEMDLPLGAGVVGIPVMAMFWALTVATATARSERRTMANGWRLGFFLERR